MATIGIVEDSLTLIEMYSELLAFLGHSVIVLGRNGKDAVESFKSASAGIDLILMDYSLPIQDGIVTSKEILTMEPEQKILFVSAHPEIEDDAMDIGALDFIAKPFSLSHFEQLIHRCIGCT